MSFRIPHKCHNLFFIIFFTLVGLKVSSGILATHFCWPPPFPPDQAHTWLFHAHPPPLCLPKSTFYIKFCVCGLQFLRLWHTKKIEDIFGKMSVLKKLLEYSKTPHKGRRNAKRQKKKKERDFFSLLSNSDKLMLGRRNIDYLNILVQAGNSLPLSLYSEIHTHSVCLK